MLNCSTFLTFIIAIGVFDLAHVYAQDRGSPCRVKNRPGICELAHKCDSVYQQLLSGNHDVVTCGYEDAFPVICCPDGVNNNVISTTQGIVWGVDPPVTQRPMTTTRRYSTTRQSTYTTRRPTTSRPWGTTKLTTRMDFIYPGNPWLDPLSNQKSCKPAKKMCSEYAKYVYEQVRSPVSIFDEKVNISTCAVSSKKLIVGGTKAAKREVPHMAAIGYVVNNEVQWKCGGSLISDRYILSAAHCTYSYAWGNAEWARLGVANLNDKNTVQDRRIIERIRHENYNVMYSYNDIALFKLDRPVNLNGNVRPACLSLEATTNPGESALAAGWGVQEFFDDSTSEDLLKVTVPLVTYARCRQAFPQDTKLPNGLDMTSQVCAGGIIGKDTCQGDSGGPLMVFNKDEECMYDIIGITSFGKACGLASPGVYTKVSKYIPWIEKIVWPNVC